MEIRSLQKVIAVAIKDMRVYYLKGPTVIFGLLFPFFFFLSFIIGREMNPIVLLPGLTAMVVFFSATAIGPVIFPTETRAHTLERLVSMPVSLWAILLGDVLASTLFALLSSIVPLILALLFIGMTPSGLVLTFIGILIGSICFSYMGQLMSSPPVDQTSTIMMNSTLIKFPLVFISGIFVVISALPEAVRFIALLSPLTYLADLFRTSFGGVPFFNPVIDILALSIWTVGFVTLSLLAHRRTLERRL